MYVRAVSGRSASVAVLVMVKRVNSLTIWSPITGSTGAEFVSRTTTLKVLVALKCCALIAAGLSSVTIVVRVKVLSLCAGLAVQVMTPLVSMLAPAGGSTSV